MIAMPEPAADPNLHLTRRVARQAIGGGLLITVLKFVIFVLTGSMAVFGDAVESIVNVLAAVVMLHALRLASEPPDAQHPYGHGKIEFMAVGLEGLLVVIAALAVAGSAVWRWVAGAQPQRLDLGLVLVSFVSLLTAALAWHVWSAGRRYQNATLVADGVHLWTDALTTLGILAALLAVWLTGWNWIDHAAAIALACFIGYAGCKLMRSGFDGLMDRADPEDDSLVLSILDEQVRLGRIRGYHKVRHRHAGPFHWVDMHLQVDPALSLTAGHETASEVEGQIERALGQANATAHVEPG